MMAEPIIVSPPLMPENRIVQGGLLIVTKMLGDFCLQSTLNQRFSELLEKTMLTNLIFRFLVIGQQAIH